MPNGAGTASNSPCRVRTGINTGFCNVGNFGSADRMDYAIVGAEANLAARLQSSAEPGRIVMSFETYALVRDFVPARPLPPMPVEGLSRAVRPFLVEGPKSEIGGAPIFNEHASGLDFFMDSNVADEQAAVRLRQVLQQAIGALDARRAPG